MRYVVAGVLIVLGLIVGAIGIGQKTVWAPDDTITAAAQPSDGGPVLIEPGVLNLYDTPATLTVEGEGEVSISQASLENMDAWLADAAHTRVTGLSEEGALAVRGVDGEEIDAHAASTDLFESVTSGDGEAQIEWDADPARMAFLVTAEGEGSGPTSVQITWPADASTPWAIPLMIIGGIIVALGIFFGIGDYRKARAEKKRRAARQERRRRLAETGMAFAIVPVVALAGCSAPELPTPEPSDPPESAMAAVTEPQLTRIVESIAGTVASADEERDADALESRATGPFLSQREAAYSVREQDDDYTLPPAVASESLVLNFASATDQWPRVTTAVTSDSESGQSQLLVLAQEDPRSDYRLWSQSVLLPGSEIPEVADSRQGSQLLDSEQSGLRSTPAEAIERYADVLENGSDSEFADAYTEDAFRGQVAEAQASQREALEEGNGSIEFSYEASGDELVAQQTADGGAIVTGLIDVTTRMSPESVDGRTGTITLPRPQSSIVGEESTNQTLVTKNQQVVTFIVPPGDEEQISLIGVSDVLTDATLEE